MKAEDMSDEELMDEYDAITELTDIFGCFSTKDLRFRDYIKSELIQRGYSICGIKTRWCKNENETV